MAALVAAPDAAEPAPPRRACPDPSLIASAGVAWGAPDRLFTTTRGPAANVVVSAQPSRRGRAAALVPGGSDRLWRDLDACVPLPHSLTAAQRASLRAQLLCHLHWSAGPLRAGGDTWELEAWRPAVSRRAVLSPRQVTDPGRRCNWGPDTPPAHRAPATAPFAELIAPVACPAIGLRLAPRGPWWQRIPRAALAGAAVRRCAAAGGG